VVEVCELKFLLFPLIELDDFPIHEIDGRNQHESLTGIPAAYKRSFSCSIELKPKWKMDTASAASAEPARKTSTKWSAPPAPPEAMTGMRTALAITRVSSQSKPSPVPSRSIEVSRISPAPRSSASFAHCAASRPVETRPPETKASNVDRLRFASMATITA